MSSKIILKKPNKNQFSQKDNETFVKNKSKRQSSVLRKLVKKTMYISV